MFSQGALLYISDFDFSTINPNLVGFNSFRDKYLLVLEKKGENASIFCCFTTTLRKEKLFHNIAKVGCNRGLFHYSVYHFEPNTPVTDKRFTFPTLTFVAGNKGQVFTFDLPSMYSQYKLQGKIDFKGRMNQSLIFDIIHCLSKSGALEGDVKEELYSIGDDIQTRIQQAEEKARGE